MTAPTLTPDDGERYYLSALHWIRHTAGLHYIGDAFDPEHMRELANFAVAALRGEPVIDYEAATIEARQRAREMMEFFDRQDRADREDDDGGLVPTHDQ